MVTAAGQAAYFGDALSDIDPSLPEAFVNFDKLCWQIFYRPPIFWSKQMTNCKTKLMKALEAYSRKPMEQRPDMPRFLQDWEIECIKAGFAQFCYCHYYADSVFRVSLNILCLLAFDR